MALTIFRGFGMAAIAAMCVSAAPALAQAPERGVPVAERPRPDLDPLGARMGGFLLFPSLGVSMQYNDNIFAEESNTVDDFITVISPQLLMRSDWNRHMLEFSGGADIARYIDNSREDYEHYNVGARGRVDVLRDTHLRAGVNYQALTEERGSPDDARGINPTEYSVLTPSIGAFHRFNRVSLDVDGRLARLDYENTRTSTGIIDNQGRDRKRYEAAFRAGYEIIPQYEAFLRVTLNRIRYDEAVDRLGFDRDSDGYEIVAGTRIDLTGILFGDVFAGYRSQNYDDPRLRTVSGLSFGGELTWNVTGLTTVKASLSRTVEETTLSGASGFLSTTVGGSIDHELLRNLLVGARLSYTLNDYEGIAREDAEYRAGVYGRYLMHRNLYLSLQYDYRERDSNVSGADFAKNVVMFRVDTQF